MTDTATRRPLLPFCAGLVAAGFLGSLTFALLSTDRMIDRGFATALATPSAPAQATASAGDEIVGGEAVSQGLWLTRGAAGPAAGAVLPGERIVMTVDGGRRFELEILAVAQLDGSGAGGEPGERLVMVTCRDVSDPARSGRLVRFIVDADEPLAASAARHTQRAL